MRDDDLEILEDYFELCQLKFSGLTLINSKLESKLDSINIG